MTGDSRELGSRGSRANSKASRIASSRTRWLPYRNHSIRAHICVNPSTECETRDREREREREREGETYRKRERERMKETREKREERS